MATGGHEPSVPVASKLHEPSPGNPDFNLTGVTPSQTLHRETTTAEDLELDRQLEAAINAAPAAETFGHEFHDPDEPKADKSKPEDNSRHLSAMQADYKPAKNLQELEEQISFAKEYDCDSVDVEENFAKQLRRRDYGDVVKAGYWVFKGVKVHLPGHFSKARARDNRTIYDKEYRD